MTDTTNTEEPYGAEAPATWRERLVARILLQLAAMFAPDAKTAKAIHDLHCHISVRVPKGADDV